VSDVEDPGLQGWLAAGCGSDDGPPKVDQPDQSAGEALLHIEQTPRSSWTGEATQLPTHGRHRS